MPLFGVVSNVGRNECSENVAKLRASLALAGAVAGADRRAAETGCGEHAVGADDALGGGAPVVRIRSGLRRGVVLGEHELSFPAQSGAEVRVGARVTAHGSPRSRMVGCRWPLAVGSWLDANGHWPLAVGRAVVGRRQELGTHPSSFHWPVALRRAR